MAALRSLLLFPLIIGIVGDVEIETLRIPRATGSSVLFPGLKSEVEFKGNMIYELRKNGGNPSWLMMDHGQPQVHKVYETRGQVFPENKSFLLTNLTEKDNGIYEQKLNQITLLRVILTVINPVEDPVLRRQVEDNVTCRLSLLCDTGRSENITFLINGEEIKRNRSGIENYDLLVIDGTDPQHWGNYTCTVKNLVSQKVSQELELIPERLSGGFLLYWISCAGVVIYICNLLSLLGAINQRDTSLLSKLLLYAKCIFGTSMELTTSAILLFVFISNSSDLTLVIVGIIVVFVVLMARAFWIFMLCGLTPPALIIRIMEDALFAADLLLVPAIHIQYILLYLASDLCGMRKQHLLWILWVIVIGFVPLLAVVLPLRILCVKCRASDPPGAPDPHKGSFTLAPVEDQAISINEGKTRNEEAEKETQSGEDETPT